MVNIIRAKQIQGTDKLQAEIDGKILKVYIRCNKPLPHVIVEVKTDISEQVINAHLHNQYNIFYPFVSPTQVAESPVFTNYYYHRGSLIFNFDNMNDKDKILDILVYTE